MASVQLNSYIELLHLFLNGQISAVDFEQRFLALYRDDKTMRPDNEFSILDQLFGDVDAFCADDSLREIGDLNEVQLRERSSVALKALKSLSTSGENS